MSDYLPIAPLGIDTEDVESLPSLLARMAALHGLSIVQMVRHLASWWRYESRSEWAVPEAQIYTRSGTGLCGYSANVDIYVDALTAALASPLVARTSVRALRPAASSLCQRSIRCIRAWCPACYVEQMRLECPIYDKLFWALQPVTRCPAHRIQLVTACPSCGSEQHFYHRSGQVHLCFRCGLSLISTSQKWVRKFNPDFGESECLELVEKIATGQLVWAVPNAFSVFSQELRSILSPVGRRVDSIAPASGSLRAMGKRSPPNLRTMLRRTQAAGVRLVDVLVTPIEAAHAAGLLEFGRIGLPADTKPRHSSDAVILCLNRLKTDVRSSPEIRLVGLQSLATELGVSEGFIRHQCPIEVKAYIKERGRRIVSQSTRLRYVVRKVLVGGLLEDYRQGKIVSQRKLVELASARSGAKVYLVRAVLSSLVKNSRHGAGIDIVDFDLSSAVVHEEIAVKPNGERVYSATLKTKLRAIFGKGVFSVTEIAQVNNIPLGTIRSLLK